MADRRHEITSILTVLVLDALSDNYMYLIIDEIAKVAAAVDPADADACFKAATAAGVTIAAILTTHHHFDHAGGNSDLRRLVPDIQVIGGEPVQAATSIVRDGEALQIGQLHVRCVHTPAHTNGHMSYLVADGRAAGAPAAIFTGDALFIGGCGRFFEGGPEQMLAGTAKLASLPPATLLFCGHEYTLKNLQFALAVEPDNAAAQRKILWAQQARASRKATVPSTIGDELQHNPFMRVREKAVRDYVNAPPAADDVLVMRKLRNAKDGFAGSSRPWIPGGGPLPGL